MTTYIFKKIPAETDTHDSAIVVVKTRQISLPELLTDFEDFLRGAGFAVKYGSLVIDEVEDDATDKTDIN